MSTLAQVALSITLNVLACWMWYRTGYRRGRKFERMARLDLDLTGLALRDPFEFGNSHITRFHSSVLAPVVTPAPPMSLEDALKKHIRERKPS